MNQSDIIEKNGLKVIMIPAHEFLSKTSWSLPTPPTRLNMRSWESLDILRRIS
jgi:hypothetical protein